MALLTSQSASAAGTQLSYASAAGGGDTFANSGKEFIHVKNGSGSPITVTIAAQHACSFGVTNAAHDLTVTVGAGADKMIGPFDKDRFNDTDGLVHVGYSLATSVTVAVIK